MRIQVLVLEGQSTSFFCTLCFFNIEGMKAMFIKRMASHCMKSLDFFSFTNTKKSTTPRKRTAAVHKWLP